MSDLFDDLEDFGAFDDVVSGNVRDPYPELAKQRHETPIQRIDMSAMPGEEGKPVFIVYRHEDIQTDAARQRDVLVERRDPDLR